VASYRPRSSLLLFSRLLGEKFAGTPIAEHFAAGSPETAEMIRSSCRGCGIGEAYCGDAELLYFDVGKFA